MVKQTLDPERATDTVRRGGSLPLEPASLDEVATWIPRLPEPLALLAENVEVARDMADHSGTRMRLFDLAIGVVRYGVSVGLARLAEHHAGSTVPRELGQRLLRAGRMSDGQWCDLSRLVAKQVSKVDEDLASRLAFTSGRPLARVVVERNAFIHEGGSGDAAAELTLDVLGSSQALLELDLRVVVDPVESAYQSRRGLPRRKGLWRPAQGPVPMGLGPGDAYLAREVRDVLLGAFFPREESRVLLLDGPHTTGKSWRSLDPEIGEHRLAPLTDRAIRDLGGADPDAPVTMTNTPALVGRQAATSCLVRAAEEARDGGVRVLVYTGAQGIGRSRMLSAIRDSATAFGFVHSLDVRCSPNRASSLGALTAALKLEPDLASAARAVERALAGDGMATAHSFNTAIEAIEAALWEISQTEPLLLLVDDAQWADEEELRILRLMTERANQGSGGHLCAVVAVRDEPNPSRGLLDFLGQVERDVGSGATRVTLSRLNDDEAAQLARNVAPLAPELEQSLVRGSHGVPFLLVQPLLVWCETGALDWREGRWCPIDPELLERPPPGLSDLVLARLDSFFDPRSQASRAALRAVTMIALADDGLSLPSLLEACSQLEVATETVELALEGLCDAALVSVDPRDGSLSIPAPMVRQALLELGATRPWYRRTHRALLEVFARHEEPDAEALARGFESVGDPAEAYRWRLAAYERAKRRGNFAHAARILEGATRLAQTEEAREEVQLLLCDALYRAGYLAEAHAAHSRTDWTVVAAPGLRLRAKALGMQIGFAQGNFARGLDRELIAEADEYSDPTIAVAVRLSVAERLRDGASLDLVRDAIERLKPASPELIRDLAYRAHSLRFELLYELHPARRQEQASALRDARRAARQAGSRWAELDVTIDMAAMEAETGDPLQAIRMLTEVEERARELSLVQVRRTAIINVAACHLRSGAFQQARESASQAERLARDGRSWRHLSAALSVAAAACLELGELDVARRAIDESIELKLAGGDSRTGLALMRRSRVLSALGDYQAAKRDAEQALAEATGTGNADLESQARLRLHVDAMHTHEGHASELAALLESIDAANAGWDLRRLIEEAEACLRAVTP